MHGLGAFALSFAALIQVWYSQYNVGETPHTLQLNHQHIFDDDISKVLSDRVALVGYCK